MSKRYAVVFVAVTTFAVAFAFGAQEARWAAADDQTAKWMMDMERKWAEADCDGNLAMQTFLADDFQGTAPDGSRYTKAHEVQETKTSKDRGTGCRLGEVKVHFFGDNLALLYGSESRLKKAADGTPRPETLIWTDTWLKRDGHWQIVAAHDSWGSTKGK